MAQSQLALGFVRASGSTGGTGVNMWQETVLAAAAEQAKETAANPYLIEVDNTVAGSALVYLRGYFALTGSVTLGTTDPDLLLPIPATTRLEVLIVPAQPWPTALAFACTSGNGTSTGAPSQNVITRVVYT